MGGGGGHSAAGGCMGGCRDERVCVWLDGGRTGWVGEWFVSAAETPQLCFQVGQWGAEVDTVAGGMGVGMSECVGSWMVGGPVRWENGLLVWPSHLNSVSKSDSGQRRWALCFRWVRGWLDGGRTGWVEEWFVSVTVTPNSASRSDRALEVDALLQVGACMGVGMSECLDGWMMGVMGG